MSLPPSEIPEGAIRFNTDSQRLEFYAQGQWWIMSTDTPNLGRGYDATPGVRGLFTGGYASGASSPKVTNKINYVNIASTGNAQEFGTLTTGAGQDVVNCGASRTRGVFRDGDSAPMSFVTFASTGVSQTFGNSGLTANRASGLSNETRGIHGGSGTSSRNQLEFITIASTGAAVDFGNLITGAHSAGTGASATRGIYAGCASHPTNNGVAIEYLTIATLGNAQDFGDLQRDGNSYQTAAASNATRMFVMDVNVIEFIQIQTLGNAIDFGQTSSSVQSKGAGCASSTRAVFAGGADPAVNIEYIQISTQGNAVDFGDLTYVENRHGCGMSNGHGGL